jgi:hypothetical protein
MQNIKRNDDEILTYFYTPCRHMTGDLNDHVGCTKTITKFEKDYLNANITIKDAILTSFLKYIFTNSHYYPSESEQAHYFNTCVHKNKQEVLNFLKKVVDKQPLVQDHLKILTNSSEFAPLYFDLKKYFTKEFFSNIITKQLTFCDISRETDIAYDYTTVDFLLSSINIQENLIMLSQTRVEKISQRVSQYLEKDITHVNLSLLLKATIDYLPYTRSIITTLFKLDSSLFDNVITEKVCKVAGDLDLEFYLNLTQSKSTITKECYDNILISERYVTTQETLKLKEKMPYRSYEANTRLKQDHYYSDGYTKSKILILIKYKYKITQEDVYKSVMLSRELPNIETYGVKLDVYFVDLCKIYNFYPDYPFTCVDPKQIVLQGLCTKQKVGAVKDYIKLNKLVPDIICLENACKLKNGGSIIKLLIENNCDIDFQILELNSLNKTVRNMPLLLEYYKKKFKVDIKEEVKEVKKIKEIKVKEVKEVKVKEVKVKEVKVKEVKVKEVKVKEVKVKEVKVKEKVKVVNVQPVQLDINDVDSEEDFEEDLEDEFKDLEEDS